jgi:hypothetical protein
MDSMSVNWHTTLNKNPNSKGFRESSFYLKINYISDCIRLHTDRKRKQTFNQQLTAEGGAFFVPLTFLMCNL